MEFFIINLDEITPNPENPRKIFDQKAIDELAISVASVGVLQPILVRPMQGDKSYELVCGERRYRASIQAGKDTIPCIVREISDEEALELMLTENMMRQDVHPMEEAAGFAALQRVSKMTVKDIAQKIGKNWHYVADRLKLAKLIPELQKEYYQGRFNLVTATAIASTDVEYQRSWMQEQDEDDNDWSVNNVRSMSAELSLASFDTEDKSLLPSRPVCSACPSNSANSSLFPEGGPVCLNKLCYAQKERAALDRVVNDLPEGALIALRYGVDSDLRKNILKKVDNSRVYMDDYGFFNSLIDPPSMEELDELGDAYNPEEHFNIDDEDEWKQAKVDAEKEYQKSVEEYNSAAASEDYLKVFVIDSDSGVTISYVSASYLAKKSAASKPAVKGTLKDLLAEVSNSDKSVPLVNLSAGIDEFKKNMAAMSDLRQEKIFERVMKVTRDVDEKVAEILKRPKGALGYSWESEPSYVRSAVHFMLESLSHEMYEFVKLHLGVVIVNDDGEYKVDDFESHGYFDSDDLIDGVVLSLYQDSPFYTRDLSVQSVKDFLSHEDLQEHFDKVAFHSLQRAWMAYATMMKMQFKNGYRAHNVSDRSRCFIDWMRVVDPETIAPIERDLRASYEKKLAKMQKDLKALEDKLSASGSTDKKKKKVKTTTE